MKANTNAYSVPEVREPTRATPPYTTRQTRSARSEWDAWLGTVPGAGHILQSHEWGEFKRRLGWRPVRVVLERPRDCGARWQYTRFRFRYTTSRRPAGMPTTYREFFGC